jgi:hypothetical protein
MHRILFILSLVVSNASAHDGETSQPFERPHTHEDLEGHAHVGWDSSYFSEGRDGLDGDSLWSTSFELAWEHLSAGVWYGISPDQNYDELQLSLALSQSFGDVEVYLGYTHLRFPFEDGHDNEIGAGLSWSGLPWEIKLSTDFYYSVDAEGFFGELALSREVELTEQLSLGVDGIFGMNQGYVSDGHDGANHFALRVGFEYALTDSWTLAAHSVYSWALDRKDSAPGDDTLRDFFHGGLGLQWSF